MTAGGLLRGGKVRLDEVQLDFLYCFKFLQRNIDSTNMYPVFHVPLHAGCQVKRENR